jgi:hypothetical protein
MNRLLTGNHVSWLDPQMMICEQPCLGLPGVCQESRHGFQRIIRFIDLFRL